MHYSITSLSQVHVQYNKDHNRICITVSHHYHKYMYSIIRTTIAYALQYHIIITSTCTCIIRTTIAYALQYHIIITSTCTCIIRTTIAYALQYHIINMGIHVHVYTCMCSSNQNYICIAVPPAKYYSFQYNIYNLREIFRIFEQK